MSGRRLALDSSDPADPSPKQDRVLRYDRATIGKAELTSQGYLKAPAYLTKTGVFDYQEPDPLQPDRLVTRKELRLASEVFAADSLASVEDVPLTLDHPWFGRVDARTFKDVAIGVVRGARKADDGEHVEATVLVQDANAVQAALSGEKRQISVAYYHTREPIPGGKYTMDDGSVVEADFIQRNIEANHVALVEAGRAGPTAQLRLDSAGNQIGDEMDPKELLKQIGELQAQLAAATKLNTDSAEANKQAQTKVEAEKAAMQAEVDRLKKEHSEMQLKLDAAAKAKATEDRARFIDQHAEHLDAKEPAQKAALLALDDADLQRRVLAKVAPELKLDGKDAAFVAVAFETTMSLRELRTDTAAVTAEAVHSARRSPSAPVAATAKAAMEAEMLNAWKPKAAAR